MRIKRLRSVAMERLAEPDVIRRLLVVLLALVAVAFALGAYGIVRATQAATDAEAAAIGAKQAIASAKQAVTQQNEGRKLSQRTICGGLNAVISAGRDVIQSGATIDPAELDAALRRYKLPIAKAKKAIAAALSHVTNLENFTKMLKRYGLPPQRTIAALSRARALTYVHKITSIVTKEGGAASVVRSDGLLDCAKLRRVTNIP